MRVTSLASTEAQLIQRIDSGIRKKFSFGADVKCLSIEPVKGGYFATYQRADGSVVSIDSFVENSAGNILFSYRIREQNANGGSQSSSSR